MKEGQHETITLNPPKHTNTLNTIPIKLYYCYY